MHRRRCKQLPTPVGVKRKRHSWSGNEHGGETDDLCKFVDTKCKKSFFEGSLPALSTTRVIASQQFSDHSAGFDDNH